MGETFEFTLKRVSLTNCCLLLWFGLTLILNVGSEMSTSEITIGEVKQAEAQIEIGATTNITCRMNRIHFNENNSSCLPFYQEHNNTLVPKENIHDAEEKLTSKYNYKFNRSEVASTNIVAGTSTNNVVGTYVTYFKCRDNNFKSLTCIFTIPESKIHTDYQLIIVYPKCRQEQNCPTCQLNTLQKFERICEVTGTNYRQIYDSYSFTLIANNSLGRFTEDINIHHSKYLVPPKPNVKVENLTTNSVTLILDVHNSGHYINKSGGLEYNIRLCPEKFECITEKVFQKNSAYKAKIENLQYPYRRYNFTVEAKTFLSNESDSAMWSEPFKGSFSTMSRRPDRAPNADIGSYFIDSTKKNIILYWEKLAEYEKNGPGFNYSITVVREGKLINHTLLKMDENSALFTYDNTSDYIFKLYSQNENGTSLNSSVFEIHPQSAEISKQEITKICNQQNNTYTVVWEQSKDFDTLSNLTIFYCKAKTGSQSDCMGDFHFETLEKNKLNYTITTEKNLNFALSKNYIDHSTGMLWATCVLDKEPNVVINNITTITLDSSIQLQWTAECWYGIIFKEYEYNLTYCMVKSNVQKECFAQIKSKLIPIMNSSYLIEGLQPSTNYKVWISMVSPNNEVPLAEYVFKTEPGNNNTKRIIIIVLAVVFSVFFLYASVKYYLYISDIKIISPDGLPDFEIETSTKQKIFGVFRNLLKKQTEVPPVIDAELYSSKMIKNNDCHIGYKVLQRENHIQMQHSNYPVNSSTYKYVKCGVNSPIEEYIQMNNVVKCGVNLPIEGYLKMNNVKSELNGYVQINELNSGYMTKKQLLDISQGLKFIWFLVITMCLATSPVSGSDYVGEVIPHDVELPIGGSVNITCRMNRSYFNDHNSSCLSFFRDDGNLRVPKEHIHVVDDSSIVFMVRNASEQRAQYTCKCHDKGVYITNIFVGTPPTNVTDFQCLGYDFSFLTCNFTVPHNKIYTDYKLKFSTSSPDYIYTCNLENGLQPSERICNITMDNSNYRIVYQNYNFELTARNSLGTLTQSIMIDQYNRIVPARPLIEVANLTTNSVTLYWMVNKFSQYTHTDGLQYEIRLRPEKFDWFYINTNAVLQKNKEHYKAEINNLQYPYRRYDFSVRVKTVRANNSDEKMWSKPYEGFFYTKPKQPERAPNMDVGSFYIDPTEQNIRLYWQQIAEYEENGPDFLYNITEVRRDGKLINAIPSQMDSTSATYNWERTSHYQFKLQSENQVGKSLNASTLEVHPSSKRSQQIEQIQVITKVYHNQTYTITWRQPSDMDSLRNFTLFWCISKMESQSQCKGTINFKHFDKHTTNHTTEPQNHTLNFAVSANYDTYSTGMMWAMCTADGATDLNKMDPETSAISSNSIKVQWSTECLYMAILEGYNLTYCKVENHVPEMIGNCIGAEKTISISKRAKEYTITDLDPFTTYKISILMYSKMKVGPMSNPVIETTTEDAPSPPRKLKKYNITSDSVTLTWLPPKYSNGNLRYYTVWYKNEGTKVNSTSNDSESEITFHLEDLSSYSDYKVYVTAHTVNSSGPSNDIHFKTLIGIPSPPLSFNMNRNDKELVFHWSPPKLPSGRVEFYEVRVTVHKNNESETLKTSRVVGPYCKMNIPCNDPNNSYIFDVRAVNLAEKSEVDYHTFSKRDTSYFNTLHQGGTKKRRHSNAEINASIGAPYQIHETTEKNIRHRHERENLKLIQTTEPSYVTQEESDEDFICIGGEKETLKILGQYKDANQYKLFYSPWQNGPYFACSETKFSKLTVLALVVIVVTMVLLAAVYYARKKYNKMSNISLVIPEGLDDNINVSKGIDNKIERDEIIRSDELFYEKENHRLLSKVGNDSGFLNSVHCLDKNSAYACSDLQDSEKSSQSTDSVELNDITSCSYTSSPAHSPNANIREMSIPEERSNPPVLQPSVQLRPSENGYIKPIMMSNGYVQPQAFQQLKPKETPTFNGYMSLDAMGKPIFPQSSTASSTPISPERNSCEIAVPKNVNNKDNAIPQPVSGNICGYVTHKQLSDFGRLQ